MSNKQFKKQDKALSFAKNNAILLRAKQKEELIKNKEVQKNGKHL